AADDDVPERDVLHRQRRDGGPQRRAHGRARDLRTGLGRLRIPGGGDARGRHRSAFPSPLQRVLCADHRRRHPVRSQRRSSHPGRQPRPRLRRERARHRLSHPRHPARRSDGLDGVGPRVQARLRELVGLPRRPPPCADQRHRLGVRRRGGRFHQPFLLRGPPRQLRRTGVALRRRRPDVVGI
ncbi:MAG: hypothetical protein AVDCRST_MAG04-969, partial [uncultured Acetobacteraceae bacterium]